MRVKWKEGRIFFSLVAAMFLSAGGCGLWGGWSWSQKYESWKTYRLMQGAVDLSKPGEYEFRCLKNASVPHGGMLWLRLPEQFQNSDPETLFAPLQATVSIADDRGEFMELDPSATELPHRWYNPEGWVSLFSFPLFSKGERQVKVSVHRGIPALQGQPQQLEGRYYLCGCEAAPISIFNFLGGSFMVIGGLVGMGVYRGMCADLRVGNHGEKGILDRKKML